MQSTLNDCFKLLKPLIEQDLKGMYTFDENVIVMEEFEQQVCSKHVPLFNLNVYQGCSFIVY